MEIAQLINDSGVLVHRDDKQVRNKIQHLERQFWEAFDFANTETGVGLLETDRGAWDDAVLQRCSHYFDLFDVFADCASSKPNVTNMDISLASSESENISALSDDKKTPVKKRDGESYSLHSVNRNCRGSSSSIAEDASAATA